MNFYIIISKRDNGKLCLQSKPAGLTRDKVPHVLGTESAK